MAPAGPGPGRTEGAAEEPGNREGPGEADAGVPVQEEQWATDPGFILAQADDAYFSLSSLRARFHQIIEVPLLERSAEGHGIWYQKGRSLYKLDFQEPPDDEIVSDGTYLWLYYPSTNPGQVIRSELASGGTKSGTADLLTYILEEGQRSYTATYEGVEEVEGVPTHHISLLPLSRSPYRRIRVWISTTDHFVRKFEILEQNETLRVITLTDLEPDAAIPDALFEFEVPADANVFEG
jgi:outer membrane lipoprotein carrier protein